MGSRNPDRIPFASYAATTPTVGKMLAAQWRVQAKCNACGLTMNARLRDIVRLRGPDLRLWGAASRCRDVTCIHGRMTFYGRPPGFGRYVELMAENDPDKHRTKVPAAPSPPLPREPAIKLRG